jgi:hypothetical protein
MAVLIHTTRPDAYKHTLCQMADGELALLEMRITKVREMLAAPGAPWLSLISPLLPHTPVPGRHTIQARYTLLVERVSTLRCYAMMRKSDKIGEEGALEWLSGFMRAFRGTSVLYRNLCQDVTVLIMAFIVLIRKDALLHTSLGERYAHSFDEALARLRFELAGDDDGAWDHLWAPKLAGYVDAYPFHGRSGECLLIGITTLGEAGAVLQCAAAFRCVLWKWDESHGLDLPRVQRILDAFAYAMEPLYERKRYVLSPLF